MSDEPKYDKDLGSHLFKLQEFLRGDSAEIERHLRKMHLQREADEIQEADRYHRELQDWQEQERLRKDD